MPPVAIGFCIGCIILSHYVLVVFGWILSAFHVVAVRGTG